MTMSINNRFRGRLPGRTSALLLCACMSIAAGDAWACEADGENLIRTTSRVYNGYAAGDVIADWASTGSATYLHRCAPNGRGMLTISAAEASIGSVGGFEMFETSNPRVGMQIRYRYPRGRSSIDGSPIWSAWIGLTETPSSVNVATHIGFALDTEYVNIDTQMRLVALTDISGDQHIPRTQIMTVDDETFGTTLNQKVFEAFDLYAPRDASCWFRTLPTGNNVKLPDAHSMRLNKEGALSDPASFTWSWACDEGNQGHTGGGDFMYEAATTVTDPTGGRMSVTGGAKGVDLLVTTTRNGGGKYMPIEFNRWYSNLSGGGLGLSGTESLQVHYVRNAEADLVVGTANGGLKIVLEPY